MIAAASVLALLAIAWLCWRGGGVPLDAEWVRYRDRFVSEEGRVIDQGRGGISTSESQGFGMLLAEAFNDRITFDRVWRWTRENLDKRDDGLFVWRWAPPGNDSPPDVNNATDGDLLIAWALARAGRRWDDGELTREANRRAEAIRSFQILAQEVKGRFYLLPGAKLFERPDGIVINPSYFLFPAFRDLQAVDPNWLWGQLTHAGLRVLEEARYGAHKLPPDWLLARADGTYALPERFDHVSGYEALRIPLYLLWADFGDEELLRPFARAWAASRQARAVGVVFDLESDQVKTRNVGAGFLIIERAVDCALTGYPIPAAPKLGEHDDYYSASLYLLTLTMLREVHPHCLKARE